MTIVLQGLEERGVEFLVRGALGEVPLCDAVEEGKVRCRVLFCRSLSDRNQHLSSLNQGLSDGHTRAQAGREAT